jgi:hypothetical protein
MISSSGIWQWKHSKRGRKTVWMNKTRDVKTKSNQKNKRWWNTHEHQNTKEIKQTSIQY